MSDKSLSEPQTLDILLPAIQSALQTSDISAALELAHRGLDQGLTHPLLLHLRGHQRSDQGQYEEALEDLERARQLSPNEPRISNGIGECLVKAERFAEAVAAFDQALALWPEFPLAHQNRGFALETLGEHKLAEESYRRAASLDASFADPLARLAGLAASRADWANARAFAARALALDPHNATANFTAAKVDLQQGSPEQAERRLNLVLADSSKDALERAGATKQLGDVRDAQGRIAEAFATYQDANDQFRAFFEPRLRATGVEPTPALLSRVSSHLSALPAQLQAWAAPIANLLSGAAGLVFVVGFPRSGTTLLGQILGAHPQAIILEERFPIVEADRDFLRAPNGLQRLAQASEAELDRYRQSYWKYVRGFGVHVRDKVVIDKLPMHTFRLPLIARLFPDAKILFAIRDPRDVVLSAFRRSFVIHAFTFELLDLASAARLYDGMMHLRELSRAKLPLAWHDVRNEDVVADFDAQIQVVCAFLGLPWSAALAQFAERAKRQNIATPSSAQVRGGLSAESIGQWRRYREHLAPVLPILQPWVEKFGYSAE